MLDRIERAEEMEGGEKKGKRRRASCIGFVWLRRRPCALSQRQRLRFLSFLHSIAQLFCHAFGPLESKGQFLP